MSQSFSRTFLRFVFLSAILVSFAVIAFPSHAQTNTTQPVSNTTQNTAQGEATADPNSEVDPGSLRRILDTAEQALSRPGLTDQDLDELAQDVSRIEQQALGEADRLRAERTLLRQRIESLGAAPQDGEPAETAEAQLQRSDLNEQFGATDASVKLSAETAVRAKQIRERIGERRHDRFFRSITARTTGLATPAFWGEFINGFGGFTRSFYLLLSDSASVFWKEITNHLYKAAALAFLVLLSVLILLRARHIVQAVDEFIPEHSQNAAVSGFIFYVKNGLIPAAFLSAIYWIPASLGVLTNRLDEFLVALTIAVGIFFAITSLIRVVFAPHEPARRLIAISDKSAHRIYNVLWIGLSAAVVIFILNTLATIFISPLEVKVGLSFLYSLCVGVAGLRSLLLYRQELRKQRTDRVAPVAQGRFWQSLWGVIWLVTIAILVAAFTGYIALSEFLSQQMVFGLVVILSAWLLLRFVDFLFLNWSASKIAHTAEAEVLAGVTGNAGQAAIIGAGILKLGIYSFAAMLLLLPWGYRTSDFYQLLTGAFFGFEIGGLSISVYTVLVALLLFFVGYTVTVGLKNWLNNKLLPTTSLDIGISNSISTVFGYIGVIVAAMLAISAAGFDLSNLAIVAGALSVGVGFGLQSIVNNFVSGLILLAERPIKAGDWVSTSGGDGYVNKISVRSTEIETFDRATIIVPNSSLITDTVTNWTHGNKIGRIIIPVGVGYDSDPEQVREILLQCAKDHKGILGRPEPVVFFMDFGASSLDFQLRCFLPDINYSLSVQSELRFAILKALRDAKIEIPFPQRDVNMKYPEPPPSPRPAPRSRKKPQT